MKMLSWDRRKKLYVSCSSFPRNTVWQVNIRRLLSVTDWNKQVSCTFQQPAEVCCCLLSSPSAPSSSRHTASAAEVRMKAEHRNPSPNHIALLCCSLQVPIFKHRGSCDHTPISDVTAGNLPITADGENTCCGVADWSQKCRLKSQRSAQQQQVSLVCNSASLISALCFSPHFNSFHFYNFHLVHVRLLILCSCKALWACLSPSCFAWRALLSRPPLTATILKLYSFEGSKSSMSSFPSCFGTWTSLCCPPGRR